MLKAKRILQLFHLLSHRSVVSMETIKRVCDLPERTAYRYINLMSEANIPIVYDRNAGGYRLANTMAGPMGVLNMQEVALAIICLRLMARHVDPVQRGEIEDLRRKIVSGYHYPLDHLADTLDSLGDQTLSDPNYAPTINFAISHTACASGMGLKVRFSDSGQSVSVSVQHPALQFKNGWTLVSKDKEFARDLAAIDYVTFL